MPGRNSRQPRSAKRARLSRQVPVPEGSSTNVAHSVMIPPKRYLQEHVAGIQQSIRRTLTWSYFGTTTLAAQTYTELGVVVLNSPFDPDAALGGLSATGFAKYMAFYSKCFTLGSRLKVKVALAAGSDEGASPQSAAVGLTITTNSTSLGSVAAAVEAGLCDYRVINQNPDSAVLTVAVDIAKFLDKPNVLDDNQLFCTSGANPGQVVDAHFWASTVGPLTTTTVSYILECEMDVVFTDPIPFV